MDWHPALAGLYRLLDDCGAEWCLLRAPKDPSLPRGDVDLLVSPRRRGALSEMLSARGYARLPNAGTPDAFFVKYHRPTDCWIWLHITSELSFGAQHDLLLDGDAVLEHRVRRDDAWFPAPDDQFWLLILHTSLDKVDVGDEDIERLRLAARHATGTGRVAARLTELSLMAHPAAEVIDAVRGRTEDAAPYLADLGRTLRQRWEEVRAQRPQRQTEALIRKARGLLNPWRRRGVAVALLGPDGAGKSTLAHGLQETFFLPAQQMYMEVRDEQLDKLVPLKIPGLSFAAYLLILWRRVIQARLLQARGRLVIFDRYPYHARLAPERGETVKGRIARNVIKRAVPKVGLALVLDLPGEQMYARKGERSPIDLETERIALSEMAARFEEVETVDAGRPIDAVRRDATSRIWRIYASRWGARDGAGDD